jgi:uncharacterized OB-fold protein
VTDPRVRVEDHMVVGCRCSECHYPIAYPQPLCAACGGSVVEARFGPGGTVFASTVIRIAVAGRQPPYVLAYVDLDDGPRILTHVRVQSADVTAPAVGVRIRLAGLSTDGDPLVVVAA